MPQKKSRLMRKQESRSLRRAVLFTFLTILLGLAIVFLGIPALIRLAVFVGNLRSTSTPIESQDTLAPAPPRLESLFEATNSANINLQGFTESGVTVEIFLNDIIGEKIIAEADGSFLFSNLQLEKGENEIYVLATDQNGNQSQKSNKLIIIYDNIPPELNIIEPTAESQFSTDEEKVEIKGKIEESGTITINDRFVILNSEGNFSYPINLQEGENKIKIIAIDKAGNQTEKEMIITRE